MLSSRTIKVWSLVHKWTSLVCTAFLLLLCVTGLPLIFYEEIEHLLGNAIEAPDLPAGTAPASLDSIVAAGMAQQPDEFIQFLFWDEHDENVVYLSLAEARDAPPDDNRILGFDARTGAFLAESDFRDGVMFFLYRLHVDLFAGLPGMLFLGFMGLLFVASIVSGVVLYAPFMRKLEFGTLRKARTARLKWLDLHNLLGIVTLLWALVVGATGVINTWADLVIQLWRHDQLAAMVAPYQGKPLPAALASLDGAVATAGTAASGMKASFIAFPGSLLSSDHHYMVAMKGETPLTSRLIKPVLVDAETGAFTDTRDMPWYVTTLLVSQPLHFGDYGGMPMKVIWALLDLVTIVVLGSGLYLWLARRRVPIEARLAQLEREQAEAALAASSEALR
ncbi:MAG: PepSY-associated TM helix domain-containing protein [Kiloniellales bacterium]